MKANLRVKAVNGRSGKTARSVRAVTAETEGADRREKAQALNAAGVPKHSGFIGHRSAFT